MHHGWYQATDIEATSRLSIVIDPQASNMANRMNLNFMLNGQDAVEATTEAKTESAERFRPLLTLRPRPAQIQTTNASQTPKSKEIKGDTETEAGSPRSSSSSEWSSTEGASRQPSSEHTLPPMRLECPKSEETPAYSFTGLPPIQCLEWPSFFGQGSTRDIETHLPRILCDNNSHRRHSCGNCWFLDEFGDRSWSCCQCKAQSHTNFALEDYQKQLELLAQNRTRQLSSRGDTRISRSPRRHEPYGRRASYPSTQSSTSRMLPPSPQKGRRKSNASGITKVPHSNKKYPREQVYWMRYMKEDCRTKYKTMARDLWELQWPGSRPSISHQSLSSRHYRDNLVPLIDSFGCIVYTECGKVIMDSAKVTGRNSPGHKGIPYTFVEKLPHQALMFDWVSEEHKEQARKVIAEDEKNPDSKPAIYRRALREFEAAINPPPNSTHPTRNARKLADAAGYVILVENETVNSACCCVKKSKDSEHEAVQVLAHPPHCPANDHPALRLCDCAGAVRSKTAMHLPACESLEWGK